MKGFAPRDFLPFIQNPVRKEKKQPSQRNTINISKFAESDRFCVDLKGVHAENCQRGVHLSVLGRFFVCIVNCVSCTRLEVACVSHPLEWTICIGLYYDSLREIFYSYHKIEKTILK